MTYVALYRATTYLRTTVSSVQPKAIQRRASASQVHVAVGASLSILFLSLQLRVANWRGRADRVDVVLALPLRCVLRYMYSRSSGPTRIGIPNSARSELFNKQLYDVPYW